MPMRASFMQIASPRPPMPPVTREIRCVIEISSSFVRFVLAPALGALLHVASRRRLDGFVPRVAQALPRGNELPAVGLEPPRPFWPPTARLLLRFLKPCVGIGLERAVHPVAALALGRGI